MYERHHSKILAARLVEPRRFIQAVTGPRQVGKTTLVVSVTKASGLDVIFHSADEPTLRGRNWLAEKWELARVQARLAKENGKRGVVLVIDEVQKIPSWSETVKHLWDEDSRLECPLYVILLGSSTLLITEGLSESLAGRFETIRLGHWSFAEMKNAFGFTIDEFIYFGGYPGAAQFIYEESRWREYIVQSLIETTIARDVLLLQRVDKPSLLRRLFELSCMYSGQILSYQKMIGQLQDAGNTTTLANYLVLLEGAGMVMGLQKFSGEAIRRRSSSPKLQVLNNALMSALSGTTYASARDDRALWGRFVESAVGAHLANATPGGDYELMFWREANQEVDFVVKHANRITAIEVKSGRESMVNSQESMVKSGLGAFSNKFSPQAALLVGGDGISVESFLTQPHDRFIA